jgi:acetolactate decarboxylase
MYQFSTYHSVFNGQYEGGISLKNLQQKGDFGIGAFDSLEGELVVLDGDFFQCKGGVCELASSSSTFAWAAVCHFSKQIDIKIPNLKFEDNLLDLVESTHEFKEKLVALKIFATFEFIGITSTDKQSKPYPSIQEIIDNSFKISRSQVQGFCIGWFAPNFMGGIKNPGFHFHFVDINKKFGGHVLNFKAHNASISIFQPASISVDFFQP